MENKLPKGWKTPLLGEIVTIKSGNSKLTKKKYIADGKYVAFSGSGPDGKINFYEHEGDAIILSAVGARCGKCFRANGKWTAIANTSIIRSKTDNKDVYRYLFYMFNNENFWPRGGTGQPFVKTGVASKEIHIPYPPISEQKRIADKLDTLLAKVKDAQSRLDKIPLILKRFRQSILASAFSGDLTKDWRDKNEIYKDWEEVKLKEKCKRFQYGTSKKSQKFGDMPVLRMGNLQGGEIDWNDLVYTSDKKEIEKFILDKNTVLFNRTNSPELVGKTSIFRGDRPAIFAGYLIRVETDDDLYPEYLNYYLNSCYADKWKYRVKTDGVSQSNINAKTLGNLNIPFPTIKEQKEIIKRVSRLFERLGKIEKNYEKIKAYTNKLEQSILAKAFKGELVPQEK